MSTKMIRLAGIGALALSVSGCAGLEMPGFAAQSQAAAPVAAPTVAAPVNAAPVVPEAEPRPARTGRNPFRQDSGGTGGGGGGGGDSDGGWG